MTAITANRVNSVLTLIGLTWFTPVIRMIAGENPRHEMVQLWRLLGVPMLAFAVFLGLWSQMASQVETSLGKIPGPVAVYEEAVSLWEDHKIQREKQAAFYERQDKRHAAKLAEDPNAELKWRTYTGKPSYVDQIVTSLKTVFMGFLIATLFAVPIGILCGLSPLFNSAMNPLIQIFKPVSPLAWLPIVTMVVSAVYVTNDPMFDKSFLTSAITVTLCSLWPTLINTSVGVASIDRDLVNVGRVLQ
ncbi:MAG: ABC transporter permease, partial [Rhodospirillales bacterium]